MGTDAQLQQALQFIRAGKRQEARHELAKLIRNSPRHAQAWYLLSLLMEDRQKQIDCLQRTLALAPDHARAKELLAGLTQAARATEQSALLAHNDVGANRGEALQPPLFPPTMLTEENDKPTERPSLAIKDEEEAYTSAKKATEPPRPERRVFARRALSVWQLDDDKEIAANQSPDIIQILVDDIARLPIITNPHQELCLGIQLQAAPRLDEILANWKPQAHAVTFPFFVCQSLLQTWALLEQFSLEQGLPLPHLEAWASELLAARRNVYALRHSRIRRFIHRVQALKEEDEATRLLNLVYEAAETLAIFPGVTLAELVRFITAHQRLPAVDEMAAWLPAIDIETFTQQVKQRAKQIQQTLTAGYLRYAMRVAQGYTGQGLEYADLVQVGFMGLLRAARKFDYRLQVRFGVYATSWIWQAIGRETADQGRTIRLPVHVQEQLRKWEIACEQFDDGRQDLVLNLDILFHAGLLEQDDYDHIRARNQQELPLPVKVAAAYERAVAKARRLHAVSIQVFPLEEIRVWVANNNDMMAEGSLLTDYLPDNAPAVTTVVDLPLARKLIEEQVFSFLSPREREVLSWRYSWEDGRERTLEEIGKFYGLTRERIRQIGEKAFKKLRNRLALGLLPDLHNLTPEAEMPARLPPTLQIMWPATADTEPEDEYTPTELNTLLAQLPRSHWHQGQLAVEGGQRRQQLVAALEALAVPAHVSDIAEQMNSVIEGKDLDEAHIYNLLVRDEETFILLGQGIFSLVQWEQVRLQEARPILTCCPLPLPDPPDYEDAFFESVLVGQQILAQGLTAGQFTRQMLTWAKADTAPQNWFLHSILSAYYLVDLIPYVFYVGGHNPVLSCTLPHGDIQDLRYHCLDALTQRLVAMPEFWWLIQQHQPIRPIDLGELFADIHPDGLDDVLQRLRLLAGLGAAQKSKYGVYRLTPLGEACANQWKKEVAVETSLNHPPYDSNTFADFVTWD